MHDDDDASKQQEENEELLMLSEHTLAMREALHYCTNELSRLDEPSGSPTSKTWGVGVLDDSVIQSALQECQQLHSHKGHSLRDFWSKNVKENQIDVVDAVEQNHIMNSLAFQRRYVHGNLPCLLQGLDSTHFVHVTRLWRTRDSEMCTDWFQKLVGSDTLVPVRRRRRRLQQDGIAELDSEGRAEELCTVEVRMDKWVDRCKKHLLNETLDENEIDHDDYLKDWHLMQFLERRKQDEAVLYTVPPHFQHDMLNDFLLRFTKGDYRFVYWGPAGSQTDLHSDVLHSYSWSYNVVGEKRWTFYPPPTSDMTTKNNEDDEKETKIILIQKEGETMFVPSGWKHEVQNTKQTLSINHNWVTCANVEDMYKCLETEMRAVDTEMTAWGMDKDDANVRESMLRGCVGMDVTGFVLMVSSRMLVLLLFLEDLTTGGVEHNTNDEVWETFFSLSCLERLLANILKMDDSHTTPESDHISTNSYDVELLKRMDEVFQSNELAHKAFDMACQVVALARQWVTGKL